MRKKRGIAASWGIVALIFALSGGCSLDSVQKTATVGRPSGVPTIQADIKLTREHHEEIDTQDGIFYTYWEDQEYKNGFVDMTLKPNGFDLSWNGFTANCVTGKGLKPSFGATLDWTTVKASDADYYGVYGWIKDPLIEYYIGRSIDGKYRYGTYEVDGETYTLYIEPCERANILNPKDEPGLPRKFLQFNADSADGRKTGPIDVAKHYNAWEDLLSHVYRPPLGWDWHPILVPDYSAVVVELFGAFQDGNIEVSDITVTKNPGRIKYFTADTYLAGTSIADYPSVAGQSLEPAWDSQKWIVKTIGNSASDVRIMNKWSGWYLTCDLESGTTEEWAEAYCKPSNFTNSRQTWTRETSGGVTRIRHSSGLYLTINSEVLEGANVACQPFHDDWASQNWTPENLSDSVRLKANWGGRYLTCTGNVAGSSVKARLLAESWEGEGWHFELVEGTDYIRMKNARSNKYLTVDNTGDGAPVVTKALDSGADSQKWKIETGIYNKTVRLKNVWSGKYLTVLRGSRYMDIACVSYQGGRSTAQIWDMKW